MRDTTTAPKRKPITKVKAGTNKWDMPPGPYRMHNLLANICSQKGKKHYVHQCAARIAHVILLQLPLLAQFVSFLSDASVLLVPCIISLYSFTFLSLESEEPTIKYNGVQKDIYIYICDEVVLSSASVSGQHLPFTIYTREIAHGPSSQMTNTSTPLDIRQLGLYIHNKSRGELTSRSWDSPTLMSSHKRPGVPTTICGCFLSSRCCF